MKRTIALVAAFACLLVASVASAVEPARNGAAETDDVIACLGLEQGEFRALSTQEADAVRATGCGCSTGLLGLNLNAKVNAKVNLNVLGAAKVKANVYANVRVR
jgi:hypothetical protein